MHGHTYIKGKISSIMKGLQYDSKYIKFMCTDNTLHLSDYNPPLISQPHTLSM